MKIKDYLNDGANWQAQAVLAFLKRNACNKDMEVGRYENGREQGYIFTQRKDGAQMNIAVYEHRNSDNLCVVVFEKLTMNTPTNTDVWENMKDKYDVTETFDCGEIETCAHYIEDTFDEFLSSLE